MVSPRQHRKVMNVQVKQRFRLAASATAGRAACTTHPNSIPQAALATRLQRQSVQYDQHNWSG